MSKDVSGSQAILRLFGVLFLAVGLLFTVVGLMHFKTAVDSGGWPAAKGRIIESTVTGPVEGKYGPMYNAEITYEYHVGAYVYTGSEIDPTSISHNTLDYAQSLTGQYPLGKKLKVYYNPDDPYDAVLVPGASGSSLPGGPLFGVIPILLGISCLIVSKNSTARPLKGGIA